MALKFYRIAPLVRSRHFDTLSQLPVPIREAELFRYTVEEMPIAILPEDILPGRYGSETPFDLPDPLPDFPNLAPLSDEDEQIRNDLHQRFQIRSQYDPAHTCLDYGRIIDRGMFDVLTQVQKEALLPNLTEEKRILLDAMERSIRAVELYSQRFAALAREMAAQTDSKAEQARLLRMANALDRVPMHPAESFYEGVVSVWLMHSLIAIAEQSWASISLGRMDQYLYPLYRKSLQNEDSREDCKAILKNLFVFLDSYGDGACTLNIGGLSVDGQDQMNELSELLIEVEKESLLRSPIFVVRVHPNMPMHILDRVIDPMLFQIGQPTFYGELPCRESVRLRGIDEAEAATFSVNSCMGLMISGREVCNMWGCMFNMHLPLELAVNGGKPLFHDLPLTLRTPPIPTPSSLDELLTQYEKYLHELLTLALHNSHCVAQSYAKNLPDPLLSALIDGCISRGEDRAIGATYENVTVETMALINTGNAIHAINELVFRRHICTLPELIQATQNNFENHSELWFALRNCEKFGSGSDSVDAICARLSHLAANVCESCNFDNVRYLPSLHTLDCNVWYGKPLGAMLDGRKAGEPVSKNANPTLDALSANPTGQILSAAALPQARYSGGQPIDLYFDHNQLSTKEQREKIRSFLLTYFSLGGLQIQVNSVDPDLLQEAYDHPEQHPHLIVRRGGYSVRFSDLSRAEQADLIQRFRNSSGQ